MTRPAPHSVESGHLAQRYCWLLVGIALNSFAIALITKSALGTSPISSLPYVCSLAFPSISFGAATFALNMLFIVAQIVLLRHDFEPVQLLQIAVNVVFSYLIDFSGDVLLSWYAPPMLAMQLVGLVAGCALLALGIVIEIAPHVIVVPGEGIVRALAAVTQRPFGSIKVVFDVTLVVLAALLALASMGTITGLGARTVISALLVGRFCNLWTRFCTPIERIRDLTR